MFGEAQLTYQQMWLIHHLSCVKQLQWREERNERRKQSILTPDSCWFFTVDLSFNCSHWKGKRTQFSFPRSCHVTTRTTQPNNSNRQQEQESPSKDQLFQQSTLKLHHHKILQTEITQPTDPFSVQQKSQPFFPATHLLVINIAILNTKLRR